MADRFRFTILGCGSSPGVPRLGGVDGRGDWGACDPENPKNRRLRCALLVERISDRGRTRVLVDATPDLRQQALNAGIGQVDGVVLTHDHADHIHGIDDLRGFFLQSRQRVEVYSDDRTLQRLRTGFRYCFETPSGSRYPPLANANRIQHLERFIIDGAGGPIALLPVPQVHGDIISLGLRVGNFGYSPDVSDLGPDAVAAYSGLDIWVVDALRPQPHPSHFSLDEALDWIDRLKPAHAVLTHMHIDLDYDALCKTLPDEIRPAYDGMVMELPVEPI